MTASSRWMQQSLISYTNDCLKRIYYHNDELSNVEFLRIAYDNTVCDVWQNTVISPFVRNATEEQLEQTYQYLRRYKEDKQFLQLHILNSKQFRQNGKQRNDK